MKPLSRISVCPDCGGEKDSRASICAMCSADPMRRFWLNVEKTDGCWLWKGSTIGGYGRLRVGSGRRIMAHRFAYELLVGPIPDGLEPDHLCRNHACVNPAHIEPVTHRENVLRGTSPAAVFARRWPRPVDHPRAQAEAS